MSYKKYSCLLLLLCCGHFVSAQGLESSIGIGKFNVPRDYIYERPSVGWHFSIAFDYQWTPEWTIGTSLLRSNNSYLRESQADTPMFFGSLPVSGEVNSEHLSINLNRKFTLPFGLEGQLGIGLGVAVDANRFYHPIQFDDEAQAYRGFNLVENYTIGLIVPGQLGIFKSLGHSWRLGLEGGLFLDRQFRNRGSYWGPSLAYEF